MDYTAYVEMVPSPTTNKKVLRSNSALLFTLDDIRLLIDASKKEIIESFKLDIEKLSHVIETLSARVNAVEQAYTEMKSRHERVSDEL